MLLIIAGYLIFLAFFADTVIPAPGRTVLDSAISIASLVAIAGIWRRAVWGRFLATFIIVLTTFSITACLLPDIDAQEQLPIQQWLAGLLPNGLYILFLMGLAAIILLPLVALGWNPNDFRKSKH